MSRASSSRHRFQSTLLMRGATAPVYRSELKGKFQSTLLMRGATSHQSISGCHDGISIHAPHARSDDHRAPVVQSIRYFNPRSSCEERRAYISLERSFCIISIHAPHARSDTMWGTSQDIFLFQSTLLMRGATGVTPSKRKRLMISIHAPHARSDCVNFRH